MRRVDVVVRYLNAHRESIGLIHKEIKTFLIRNYFPKSCEQPHDSLRHVLQISALGLSGPWNHSHHPPNCSYSLPQVAVLGLFLKHESFFGWWFNVLLLFYSSASFSSMFCPCLTFFDCR